MTARDQNRSFISLTATTISGKTTKRLFGGLLGRGLDEQIDIPTAVMIPLVAAMMADGYIDDREIEQIHSICRSSPIFERNSEAEVEHTIARASRILENDGMATAFGRVAQTLSMALRETSFVHAVRVIFSDGYVGDIEKQIIEQMVELLSIEPSRARDIVEVVSIMHHPASA